MRITILLSFVSLTLVMTSFGADKSDDAKDIQGAWLPVKAELGGEPMGDDVLRTITLKLDAGKYEVSAESVDKGTYVMDPAAKPKTLDITGTQGPNAGKKIGAIYELQGDTLRVCYRLGGGGAHPAEFKTVRGTQDFLVIYQRKKP